MKRIICDRCHKAAEPDDYGLAPSGHGWMSVSLRDERGTRDYCSPGCAIAGLTLAAPVSVVERALEGHDLVTEGR
jgi:hypothetical protein